MELQRIIRYRDQEAHKMQEYVQQMTECMSEQNKLQQEKQQELAEVRQRIEQELQRELDKVEKGFEQKISTEKRKHEDLDRKREHSQRQIAQYDSQIARVRQVEANKPGI